MRKTQTSSQTPPALLTGLLVGLLAALGGCHHLGSDTGTCEEVEGPFTAVSLPPDQCSSPVGFCTEGILTGEIEGTYAFMMTSSEPAPSADHPTREVFTGISTITTAAGVMYGEDTGEIWFDGDPGFITYIHVVEGDQCFEEAYGDLTAFGELDLATGESIGHYTGNLCTTRGCSARDLL